MNSRLAHRWEESVMLKDLVRERWQRIESERKAAAE